jgi:hypothetical protein
LSDADVYFFFNESDQKQSLTATLRAAKGKTQIWNPLTGDMKSVSGASVENGVVRLPLEIGPYGTELVVIGEVPSAPIAAMAIP